MTTSSSVYTFAGYPLAIPTCDHHCQDALYGFTAGVALMVFAVWLSLKYTSRPKR